MTDGHPEDAAAAHADAAAGRVLDALAALPPEGAEQAMFRLHASFPTTSSPSLAAVVTLYRRKASALVSALLRRSVHSCPLASISTMSNTLSSPEHAT